MSEPFEPYTATREEMKKEAIERMKILGFDEKTIYFFEKENFYFESEEGLLFKPNYEEHQIAETHAKEYGYLVFHIIHSFSNIGETLECLTVSPYKEDWDYEKSMLKEGILIAYVYNYSFPENSESGSIKIEKGLNGFIRTA